MVLYHMGIFHINYIISWVFTIVLEDNTNGDNIDVSLKVLGIYNSIGRRNPFSDKKKYENYTSQTRYKIRILHRDMILN